jgi:hypothetical protein
MVKTNCHKCEHRQGVPGNFHIEIPGNYYIKCTQPDNEMNGNARGIGNGWFIYPLFFDPVWMTKDCKNYFPKGGKL